MSYKKGLTFKEARHVLDNAYLIEDAQEIFLAGGKFDFAQLTPIPEEVKETLDRLLKRFKPMLVVKEKNKSTRHSMCPRCGHEVLEGYRYCGNCAQRICWDKKVFKTLKEKDDD